jgi:hypothetical protein
MHTGWSFGTRSQSTARVTLLCIYRADSGVCFYGKRGSRTANLFSVSWWMVSTLGNFTSCADHMSTFQDRLSVWSRPLKVYPVRPSLAQISMDICSGNTSLSLSFTLRNKHRDNFQGIDRQRRRLAPCRCRSRRASAITASIR